MDRFLTHVRPQTLYLLSPIRRLSSYKPNAFDLKARFVGRRTLRALLALVDQLEGSHLTYKHDSSVTPLVADTTYVSLREPHPRFPFPGRIGPDTNKNSTKSIESVPKLDPSQYGVNGQILVDDLLKITLPANHQSDSIRQLMNTHMTLSLPTTKNEFLSKLIHNDHLEIRAYDCPFLLRHELHRLFLNYNTLMKPLTAITIVLKTKLDMSTWSPVVEEERNQLTEQFVNLAHEICAFLTGKQYWADFIDPTSGRPYYGPHTSDTLFETDERFRYFGVNIVDLGCCRVVEHLEHGTHVFVGCIFTSALKHDPNVKHVLKEFNASTIGEPQHQDESENKNDNNSVLSKVHETNNPDTV